MEYGSGSFGCMCVEDRSAWERLSLACLKTPSLRTRRYLITHHPLFDYTCPPAYAQRPCAACYQERQEIQTDKHMREIESDEDRGGQKKEGLGVTPKTRERRFGTKTKDERRKTKDQRRHATHCGSTRKENLWE